jgi:hypothetical protein
MKSVKFLVPVFIVFFSFFTTSTHAQQQKRTYYPHEELELQDGLKVEILRSRGEGDNEELDVIYYTTKRQLGKRMWERADVIREKEQTAIDERNANARAAAPANVKPAPANMPAKPVTEIPHKIDTALTVINTPAQNNAVVTPGVEKLDKPATAAKPTETPVVTKQKSTAKKDKIKTKPLTSVPEQKNIGNNVKAVDSAVAKTIDMPVEDKGTNTEVNSAAPVTETTAATKQKITAKKVKTKTKVVPPANTAKITGVDSAVANVDAPKQADANAGNTIKDTTTQSLVVSATNKTTTPAVANVPKTKTKIKKAPVSKAPTHATTPPPTTDTPPTTSAESTTNNTVTTTNPPVEKTVESPKVEPAKVDSSSIAATNTNTNTNATEKTADVPVTQNADATVAPVVNDATGIGVGSKVEANVDGGWKPASVVETEGNLLYKVHFDGETSDDDEWMAASQVRKATPLVAPVASRKEDKSAPLKTLKAADKSAAQNCTFKAPVPPVSESEQFSLNLAKRKIYDAYVNNMKKAATPASKYGMTFISINTLEPFINTFTMLSSGSTQYKYPEAPPGAYIYTIRSKHVVCEQYAEGVKRTLVEANYGCFRNRDGSWSCRVIGSPDEREID